MTFFYNSEVPSLLEGQYVLLDNDFLGVMFSDEEYFKDIVEILHSSDILIDPLTKFEFLRDIYVPEQKKLRDQFINKEIFIPTPSHFDLYQKIQNNALILSILYAHQNSKHIAKPSVVDLFLAGRMMLANGQYLLITGNTKDFPDFLFDTLGILSFKQIKEGNFKNFGIIKFSFTKYNQAFKLLENLNNRN